jgi:hypothetical protein
MKADDTTHNTPIKAGDLLYAVGPGHHAPHSATDLLVYSTVVRAVRLDGSYSASCPPELLATAQLTIELGNDRPHLGFPKWVYNYYELGINVHRSRAEALQAFTEQARGRRGHADKEVQRALKEVQWALTELQGSERLDVLSTEDAHELAERRALDTVRRSEIEGAAMKTWSGMTDNERSCVQGALQYVRSAMIANKHRAPVALALEAAEEALLQLLFSEEEVIEYLQSSGALVYR